VWLQGEVLEAQLEYWKKQLGGNLPVLQLPTDRPRPAVQRHRGANKYFYLPVGLAEKVKDLSRQHGVTLFMTLLAAFKTLLYRYTGQEDIIVGSPIANRNQVETEGLIGFFVNTLALRTDLSGDPGFRELLGRVRQVTLGGYGHQDLPFEKLVEELQPVRDMSYSPLFQVMFVLQNVEVPSLELSGLTLSPVPIDAGTSKCDLTLFMWEEAEGLAGSVEYNTDLFDQPTIVRMLGHFERLLEGIVDDPGRRISDLPLLRDAERHQLLVEWNHTFAGYPVEKCLHELFEEQVELSPEAIAVVFEDQQITYAELNRRANRLAHNLIELGVGPETLVAISVERSVEMVWAILAILKAGGAFVPLDPAYPTRRLSFMLEDSGTNLLITHGRLADRFPDSAAQMFLLDSDAGKLAEKQTDNPARGVDLSNLAYMIYTSGSTGRPKGVMIEHRSISNHLRWRQQAYPLGKGDRFLQKASLSFDISVWEVFAPLLAGARLVLAAPGREKDPGYLANLIAEQEITTAHFSSAVLSSFCEEPEVSKIRSLGHVFCGGEALTAKSVKQFFSRFTAELHHQYGPTETTVDVTVWDCKAEDSRAVIPIGHPIANTHTYILDAHLQPVPIGVAGELHIGGESLARGYLNRPELTAEKFIPDHFSGETGARLYKTGDLARYLPDGNLEFLGRIDQQVKVRGFRIELGEIETVLGQHPGLRDVVVQTREDSPGDQRLVAYLVVEEVPGPTTTELRSFLKERLPDYMVPSAFVVLDTLPLTPNGKVDRKALPAPEGFRPELESTYVAPRNEREHIIASVWQEVLKLEKLGIHDNFFDLGGHSLLATQVVSLIESAFNIELSLRTLFETPTVSGLAEAIAREQTKQADSEALAQMLAELEQLSPDEVKTLLAFDREKEKNQHD
jgi:amino acid adenylation domain-containing protein